VGKKGRNGQGGAKKKNGKDNKQKRGKPKNKRRYTRTAAVDLFQDQADRLIENVTKQEIYREVKRSARKGKIKYHPAGGGRW